MAAPTGQACHLWLTRLLHSWQSMLRRYNHAVAQPMLAIAITYLLRVLSVEWQGFALPAFAEGKEQLIAKAKKQGIASMAIHRGRHFSALWWEVS